MYASNFSIPRSRIYACALPILRLSSPSSRLCSLFALARSTNLEELKKYRNKSTKQYAQNTAHPTPKDRDHCRRKGQSQRACRRRSSEVRKPHERQLFGSCLIRKFHKLEEVFRRYGRPRRLYRANEVVVGAARRGGSVRGGEAETARENSQWWFQQLVRRNVGPCLLHGSHISRRARRELLDGRWWVRALHWHFNLEIQRGDGSARDYDCTEMPLAATESR